MKLLYLSSFHSTLEHNHLTIFSELGIDWFSAGLFLDPKNPIGSFQWESRQISKNVDEDLLNQFKSLNPGFKQYSRFNINREFADRFDVILSCFCFPMQCVIQDTWEACKHKPVVHLTYSQQFPPYEKMLSSYRDKGLLVIRGSERESTIGSYAGQDAIIYGHVDEDIYKGWVGGAKEVLTFANDYPARINHPNFKSYRAFSQIKSHIPSAFYGVQSERGGGRGFLSFEDKVKAYQGHNAYLALSSPPSTITYNIVEAWMTGTPLITFGSSIGNGVGYSTWQAEDLIDNGINGFYSDDLNEIVQACLDIISDERLQKQFSREGRKKSLSMFSKPVVKKQWIKFFKGLGFTL